MTKLSQFPAGRVVKLAIGVWGCGTSGVEDLGGQELVVACSSISEYRPIARDPAPESQRCLMAKEFAFRQTSEQRLAPSLFLKTNEEIPASMTRCISAS